MQKGTITVDILLLTNPAQSFGGRVCCRLLAGRGKLRKPWCLHPAWRFGRALQERDFASRTRRGGGRAGLGRRWWPERGRLLPGGWEHGAPSGGWRDRACRLMSEATVFLIRGGTRHGFLVSVQNESRGWLGLCSGAGRRSPPRVGVRAASARRPRSRAPPTAV